MKTYKQYLTEEDKPKLYCDMDGVLVDLLGSIKRHLGTTKLNQGVIDDFFNSDDGKSAEFWAECGWESGGKQLWKYIKQYDPYILSACPSVCNKDKKVIKGKTMWCQKNLKIDPSKVHIVQRREKKDYANKDAILIDDRKKNIQEWETSGGTGVLHVNVNSTIKQLKGII